MIAWLLKRVGLLPDPAPDPDTEAFRALLKEHREAAERETRRLRGSRDLLDDALLPRPGGSVRASPRPNRGGGR